MQTVPSVFDRKLSTVNCFAVGRDLARTSYSGKMGWTCDAVYKHFLPSDAFKKTCGYVHGSIKRIGS